MCHVNSTQACHSKKFPFEEVCLLPFLPDNSDTARKAGFRKAADFMPILEAKKHLVGYVSSFEHHLAGQACDWQRMVIPASILMNVRRVCPIASRDARTKIPEQAKVPPDIESLGFTDCLLTCSHIIQFFWCPTDACENGFVLASYVERGEDKGL